ncbi:glycosyltransferase family 4 protein [Roseimicrobium sp. ORNL1]|uniref:glycosyltransferase family 4 protein n=1 Tax=Roseimicrobium sp. ORNL1 TaxID=2711231 RepID=UPI0013E1EAE6|nr:glycosyltransferase family 4 protein [Roseimicrobium sp. ORNL1]QIF00473.1 glycosyltransferase family 4 protein [Roseimicrobium sp. ORNL1]
MRALIFAAEPRRPWLLERTRRSLRAAGFEHISQVDGSAGTMPHDAGATLLIRAGAWLRHPLRFAPPPASGTGKPLVAFGFPAAGHHREAWQPFFRTHGGDFSHALQLPPCLCEWYDEHAVSAGLFAERMAGLEGLARPAPSRTQRLIPTRWRRVPHRLIHWSALDCGHNEHLRALEVVTSLQHGGAERIAWELNRLLPHHGVSSRMVILGSPLRQELPRPASLVDLSGLNRERRASAMETAALDFGADVLHGHLIDAEDTRLFSKVLPVVLTIHNARQAWPEGTQSLRKDDCALLIACAQMVERELKETLPHLRTRTVWNGIDPQRFAVRDGKENGKATHKTLTLVCVANPRHQKRLHLLPGILKATQEELAQRGFASRVRLILAGEASSRSPQALECMAKLEEESLRHGVSDAIIFTRGERAVEEVFTEGDVMISCSAYEGLSLAHLEGLAAGLPLVTTDAGGTAELAWRNPAVTLLPLEAASQAYAKAAVDAFLQPKSGRAGMERDFSAAAMARRTASLLHRAASGNQRGDTVWFITNNLSTGGAQSSLKRLTAAFHRQGISVRVALLQEYPEHPTPGRLELLREGVPVHVPRPVGKVDTAEVVADILAEMNVHSPHCVCFWNAIPACKLMLADALWHTPVYDVSPGEMYYTSLERCFENPPAALPYRSAEGYGSRLARVVVKYAAEAPRASAMLGTPVKSIPNGITFPQVPTRDRDPSKPLRIGTAARLSPQKRIEDLIEAFRVALPDLPCCELLIAGEAETGSETYADALKASTTDLPVRWLGEHRDLGDFHASLDIFAMISEPAGCPNASLEAMASGLPVVATDVGGASEQVLDGVTGRLVPPRNAAAFAAALVEVSRDLALCASMGRTARLHVEQHFSMDRMVAAYRALLWDGPGSQVGESALAAGAFPVFSSLHP